MGEVEEEYEVGATEDGGGGGEGTEKGGKWGQEEEEEEKEEEEKEEEESLPAMYDYQMKGLCLGPASRDNVPYESEVKLTNHTTGGQHSQLVTQQTAASKVPQRHIEEDAVSRERPSETDLQLQEDPSGSVCGYSCLVTTCVCGLQSVSDNRRDSADREAENSMRQSQCMMTGVGQSGGEVSYECDTILDLTTKKRSPRHIANNDLPPQASLTCVIHKAAPAAIHTGTSDGIIDYSRSSRCPYDTERRLQGTSLQGRDTSRLVGRVPKRGPPPLIHLPAIKTELSPGVGSLTQALPPGGKRGPALLSQTPVLITPEEEEEEEAARSCDLYDHLDELPRKRAKRSRGSTTLGQWKGKYPVLNTQVSATLNVVNPEPPGTSDQHYDRSSDRGIDRKNDSIVDRNIDLSTVRSTDSIIGNKICNSIDQTSIDESIGKSIEIAIDKGTDSSTGSNIEGSVDSAGHEEKLPNRTTTAEIRGTLRIPLTHLKDAHTVPTNISWVTEAKVTSREDEKGAGYAKIPVTMSFGPMASLARSHRLVPPQRGCPHCRHGARSKAEINDLTLEVQPTLSPMHVQKKVTTHAQCQPAKPSAGLYLVGGGTTAGQTQGQRVIINEEAKVKDYTSRPSSGGSESQGLEAGMTEKSERGTSTRDSRCMNTTHGGVRSCEETLHDRHHKHNKLSVSHQNHSHQNVDTYQRGRRCENRVWHHHNSHDTEVSHHNHLEKDMETYEQGVRSSGDTLHNHHHQQRLGVDHLFQSHQDMDTYEQAARSCADTVCHHHHPHFTEIRHQHQPHQNIYQQQIWSCQETLHQHRDLSLGITGISVPHPSHQDINPYQKGVRSCEETLHNHHQSLEGTYHHHRQPLEDAPDAGQPSGEVEKEEEEEGEEENGHINKDDSNFVSSSEAATGTKMDSNGRRQLLRPWLEERLNNRSIPGFEWLDKDRSLFKIPWKHRSKNDWRPDNCTIFREWAIHTGKYRDGADKPDYCRWKTRLRCAFNQAADIQERKDLRHLKCGEPYKVYEFLPKTASKCKLQARHRGEETAGSGGLATHEPKAWLRWNALPAVGVKMQHNTTISTPSPMAPPSEPEMKQHHLGRSKMAVPEDSSPLTALTSNLNKNVAIPSTPDLGVNLERKLSDEKVKTDRKSPVTPDGSNPVQIGTDQVNDSFTYLRGMLAKQQEKDVTYLCDVCGDQFTLATVFMEHTKVRHGQNSPR